MADGLPLQALARQHGTPLFVYHAEEIKRSVERLRHAVGTGVEILYSVKANPNPTLLRVLRHTGCGVEVASGGELQLVLEQGFEPDSIVFAGPGKTQHELHQAIDCGLRAINVESACELERIESICRERHRTCRVALRINPAAPRQRRGKGQVWSLATPFGIDEAALDAVLSILERSRYVECCGVHAHRGAELLDGGRMAEMLWQVFEMALRLQSRIPLDSINFGGGYGIPTYDDEEELDVGPIREAFTEMRSRLDSVAPRVSLAIESGRYLIGPCGYYLCQVVDAKESAGQRFVVLDGGMNHFLLRSSAFRLLRRRVRLWVLGRAKNEPSSDAEIVGPLCTPVDRLATQVPLPLDLSPGEMIVFPNAGAYSKFASPLNFLGHAWPAEVLVEGRESRLIARRVELAEVLELQDPKPSPSPRGEPRSEKVTI